MQTSQLSSKIVSSRFGVYHISFLKIAILAILFALSGTSVASAIENLAFPASIVVDANTGQVLSENAADSKRYPASVTKVMTLYILFQELHAGNLSLTTKMSVSRHAAAARPTKLGIPAGSSITVEDAIKSLVTISANDMARTIAEKISGSEPKFAERMTATARALGMRHTHYANASGWPDPNNFTTARDQAILGVAIFQHFPQYYRFFQTTKFIYGGRTYNSHNYLIGYMGAVDGLKTGWTTSSGSTILTVARKDNRHIVIGAFGYNGTKARDTKVRQLVADYLPKARQGNVLQAAIVPLPGGRGAAQVAVAQSNQPDVVFPVPLPTFRLEELAAKNTQQEIIVADVPIPTPMPPELRRDAALYAASNLALSGETLPPTYPDQDVIGAWLGESYSLGAPPAPLGQTRPSAPLTSATKESAPSNPTDLMVSGALGVADPGNNSIGKVWLVQIGAAPTQGNAQDLLARAAGKVSNLSNYRPYIERFEKNGQIFYRARFAGFTNHEAAGTMCNQLEERNFDCLALQS